VRSALAPIRGAFLADLNEHAARYWRNAVRNLHRLGGDVAIIQTEAYLQAAAGTWALDAVKPPLIEAVLDAAGGNGLSIFVGLALPDEGNGDPQAARDAGFVSTLIEKSLESGTRVHERYGAWPAFAGFYLPVETWTPGPGAELGLFRDYLERVSGHCRRLAPTKEIAISPFISDLAAEPELTATTYTSLLSTAAIDVVMLQDGVGVREVAIAELEIRVKPYLEAMQAATDAAQRQLWINAESFAGDAPAPRERFRAQVELAHSVTPDVVTFEYASYWAIAGRDARLNPRRARRRAPS
jgi:hypothetical protein